MGTTYKQLAEKISTTFYKGIANDAATYSLVHIAQMCAEEIAAMATQNARENAADGETVYSNDAFITTYDNQPVQYDSVRKTQYVVMPALGAALPNNREIVSVVPNGATKVQIIPIKNKDRFMQQSMGPIPGTVLYYQENNRICFDNSTMFNFDSVNMTVVGSVPSGDLLTLTINCPKNYEDQISQRVINRLLSVSGKPRVIIENAQGNPA